MKFQFMPHTAHHTNTVAVRYKHITGNINNVINIEKVAM